MMDGSVFQYEFSRNSGNIIYRLTRVKSVKYVKYVQYV